MANQPTLLLVEDNTDDALLFTRVLQKVYPEVSLQVVADAMFAINYLQGTGPCADREQFPFPYAVVVDLTLPSVSGTHLVKWIREQDEYKKLLITAWTGSREGRDIAELYRLGANSFLVKTPEMDDLAADIREMHEFWTRMGLLANFAPPPTDSGELRPDHGAYFFYRQSDWPGFEPPSPL
jgi:DNA-binding response OmpR family regulator